MNKAIFLDRDGTLNVEKNYLYKIEDFEFIPGMPEAIKKWNELGYKVIVVTNQAGVARGFYSENDVKSLHAFINDSLAKLGAHIDAFYYCPHHPIHGIGKYKIECNCRKPKTGMLEQAIADFDIDITKSFLFGDHDSDIEAGETMNIKSYKVEGQQFNVVNYLGEFS